MVIIKRTGKLPDIKTVRVIKIGTKAQTRDFRQNTPVAELHAPKAVLQSSGGTGPGDPWFGQHDTLDGEKEARALVYITCRLDTKRGQDLCVVEGTIWTEKRQ